MEDNNGNRKKRNRTFFQQKSYPREQYGTKTNMNSIKFILKNLLKTTDCLISSIIMPHIKKKLIVFIYVQRKPV